jgi:hypothetical protein
MIGSFDLQKQSCKYFELYSFVLLVLCQFQYCHTASRQRTAYQAPYCKALTTFVSCHLEKGILLMLDIARLPFFAALLVGVIAIAAVLWLEARRDEQRRRLVKRLESVLNDEGVRRAAEDQLKRAA